MIVSMFLNDPKFIYKFKMDRLICAFINYNETLTHLRNKTELIVNGIVRKYVDDIN